MALFNDKENYGPAVCKCFKCCDIECCPNHHSKIENLRNCHYVVGTLLFKANIC